MCVGSINGWVGSYARWDALKWRTSVTAGEPVEVRSIIIYSGWGSVEIASTRERVYVPVGTGIPAGFAHSSGKYPWHPRYSPLNAGWKKEFAGFGVMRDWQPKAPAGLALPALPELGRLFVMRPVGWTVSSSAVWAPYWFWVLVFAVMPARMLHRWTRARRRRRRGLCESCGYDLRGSMGRCPECGETILKNTGEAPVPREELRESR